MDDYFRHLYMEVRGRHTLHAVERLCPLGNRTCKFVQALPAEPCKHRQRVSGAWRGLPHAAKRRADILSAREGVGRR
jgi:hypothetical protein